MSDLFYISVVGLYHLTADGDNQVTVNPVIAPDLVPLDVPTHSGGFALFSGGSRYSSPADTAFDLTSGLWTMEGFFTADTLTGDATIIDLRVDGFDGATLFLDSTASHKLALFDGVTKFGAVGTPMPLDTERHIALSYDGTTTRCFLNGFKQWETTSAINWDALGLFSIGASNAAGLTGTSPLDGKARDARVTKGVCRYIGNFIPPLPPLPDSGATATVIMGPDNDTAAQGDELSFTISITAGDGPFTQQWHGVEEGYLLGEDGLTLLRDATLERDQFGYFVVVTDVNLVATTSPTAIATVTPTSVSRPVLGGR